MNPIPLGIHPRAKENSWLSPWNWIVLPRPTMILSPSINLSFNIPEGEIFGLLGPNGAGKTSSIRMMIGITVPDSGAVRSLWPAA